MSKQQLPAPATTVEEYLKAILLEVQTLHLLMAEIFQPPLEQPPAEDDEVRLKEPRKRRKGE